MGLIDKAFDFIAPFENTKQAIYKAYWDVSRWSIGFGTRATSPEQEITYEQAVKESKLHINASYNFFSKYSWFNSLNENQKIAVLSWSYQFGEGGFMMTSVARELENGDLVKAVERWKSQPNFKNRRTAEAKLFESKPALTIIPVLVVFAILVFVFK